MSDDRQRRDAWRDGQNATTVTGKRVFPGTHHDENIHEDHVPHGSQATDPANAAPEGGPDRYANVPVEPSDDGGETRARFERNLAEVQRLHDEDGRTYRDAVKEVFRDADHSRVARLAEHFAAREAA